MKTKSLTTIVAIATLGIASIVARADDDIRIIRLNADLPQRTVDVDNIEIDPASAAEENRAVNPGVTTTKGFGATTNTGSGTAVNQEGDASDRRINKTNPNVGTGSGRGSATNTGSGTGAGTGDL